MLYQLADLCLEKKEYDCQRTTKNFKLNLLSKVLSNLKKKYQKRACVSNILPDCGAKIPIFPDCCQK